MKIRSITAAALTTILLASCSSQPTSNVEHIYSTESQKWMNGTEVPAGGAASLQITIDPSQTGQTVEGFGTCFNELGWQSLSRLTDAERQTILKELFAPNFGANFTICRMPVAANDFSLDWYSYNETEGDFDMKNFTIEQDLTTLVPFIKLAKEYNKDIKIWASPWSPPSWMKYNKHYALAYNGKNPNEKFRNGLSKDKMGYEGQDMFIQEDKYLSSYALYFSKFIEAYKNEGIDIFAVMPQNEFNSAQVFPSCTWTAKALANFVGKYLGPAMEKQGVDVMFGTMERANAMLVDTLLTDEHSKKYVKGVGFQWAGKGAIGTIHKNYPDMPLYQTEQECGDGKNDWKGTVYSWSLLKHYMDNGVSAYMYWNTSLDEGGVSRWGWAQNSLVVVDPKDNSYRFSNEYYLMKHISHFVPKGSKYIKLAGSEDLLAFVRPDGAIVVLTYNGEGSSVAASFNYGEKSATVSLEPNSINTIVLK